LLFPQRDESPSRGRWCQHHSADANAEPGTASLTKLSIGWRDRQSMSTAMIHLLGCRSIALTHFPGLAPCNFFPASAFGLRHLSHVVLAAQPLRVGDQRCYPVAIILRVPREDDERAGLGGLLFLFVAALPPVIPDPIRPRHPVVPFALFLHPMTDEARAHLFPWA
jgi:hypothetical protein